MTGRQRTAAELESVQRSLRRLSRGTPHPEFRARLRSKFVGDAIPRPARDRWWSAPWRIAATTALIAALILGPGSLLNRGPAWRLSSASGSGAIRIDGRAAPIDAPVEIARRLRPGADVHLPAGAQLDLELPGIAVIQLVGGSHATLPGSPGRWFGRSMVASLDVGEIRISTGPVFHRNRLSVTTPEARAVVAGTTLAVLRQPDTTCVCVLEGKVAMIGHDSADSVDAGTRRSVFGRGGPPLVEPIRPMETMKLSMLRDQAARKLGR